MTVPPISSLPVSVPQGARCAVHAERTAVFACARCGNFSCEACRHAGQGGDLFCTACGEFAAGEIPLEKRGELGLMRAFGQTAAGVLIRPWEFFAARARERSLLPPLLFATAINVAVALVYAVVNLFTMDAQLEDLRNNPALRGNPFFEVGWFEMLYSPLGQLALAAFNILVYPLYYAIVATLQWAAHWIVGARGTPWREVFRAILYFQATSLVLLALAPLTLVFTLLSPQLAGLPLLPYLLFVLAWLIIAMWKVHRTELWRPVVAQGLLAMLCCCLPSTVFAIGIVAALGSLAAR